MLAAVLFVGALVAIAAYDRVSNGYFYPATRIGTVNVGSLDVAGAADELHEGYVVPLRDPITLSAPEYEAETSPWKMGMRVDVTDAAREALVRQQAEPLYERVWHRIFGVASSARISPTVDEKVFGSFLEEMVEEVNQQPKDARLDVSDDELEVIPHKLGRKVDEDAAEAAVFAALTSGDETVEIPVDVVKPELRTEAFKRVLLISTGSNRLTYYKNGEVVKRYGVATGTGGYPTPHGQWRITLKRVNPTWYNPFADWSKDMPAFIPPGPSNPLGTRALNLNASGIRIHGTPDAWSIGTNASHGCIRMHMRDIEELFEKVEVGTPVLITG